MFDPLTIIVIVDVLEMQVNEQVNLFKRLKTLNFLSYFAIVVAVLSFLSDLGLRLYLQSHRPTAPDPSQNFVVYTKALGRPFYISNFDHNIHQVLMGSYIAFFFVAVIARRKLREIKSNKIE